MLTHSEYWSINNQRAKHWKKIRFKHYMVEDVILLFHFYWRVDRCKNVLFTSIANENSEEKTIS